MSFSRQSRVSRVLTGTIRIPSRLPPRFLQRAAQKEWMSGNPRPWRNDLVARVDFQVADAGEGEPGRAAGANPFRRGRARLPGPRVRPDGGTTASSPHVGRRLGMRRGNPRETDSVPVGPERAVHVDNRAVQGPRTGSLAFTQERCQGRDGQNCHHATAGRGTCWRCVAWRRTPGCSTWSIPSGSRDVRDGSAPGWYEGMDRPGFHVEHDGRRGRAAVCSTWNACRDRPRAD